MKKYYLLFLLMLLPVMASAQVERTIHVEKAGTLSDYISDDEKYKIEKLTLIGEINSDDIKYIRLMAGCENNSQGKLISLDLSRVNIVVGGSYFYVDWDYYGIDNPRFYKIEKDHEIPDIAFRGSCLNTIILPDNLTSIGESAFSNSSALSVITYNVDNITYIGDNAFNQTAWFNNQPDGMVYIGKLAYKYKGQMPENTSISIAEGTESVVGQTFYGCTNLTSVTIPNSVSYIGKSAFSGCSGLSSITIPNSVVSIGTYTFSNCSGLTSVSIPNSISSIGYYTFSGCSSLTSVSIPDGITSMGYYTFSGCSSLTSISIPNSVTYFGYCTFVNCSSLASLTIPSSVTSMGLFSLAGCSSLTDVYCYADAVPSVGGYTDSNFGNVTLHVPERSIDAYMKEAPWNKFKEIVAIEESTEDVIKISSAGQTTWCSAYDLDFTDVEGLKAYTAEGYDRETGVIWLMRVKKVPAGEGILLIGDEGEYHVPHKATTCYYGNFMVGTLSAKTINETEGEYTNFYLSNGAYGVGFYKVDGSIEIKANRAYLPLLKNTVSGSRGFIGLGFDDDSDGTTNIQSSIFNVQSSDVYYNLHGQRVDNPSKGLYIKNGRKIFIR